MGWGRSMGGGRQSLSLPRSGVDWYEPEPRNLRGDLEPPRHGCILRPRGLLRPLNRIMPNLLVAQDLTRRFGARAGIEDLNLCLGRGEVLGLLGPNGAGKSTSLRLLAGILAPSAGRVLIDGIDLARQPQAAKARIGFLPDPPPLYPDLRVDEFLIYGGRLQGLTGTRLADALVRAKSRCGLDGQGRRLTRQLSRGFQQRLGIAQALLHQPPLLILDEPTTGLDPLQIQAMRELIAELGQECGIILSTHSLPEAQALCRRVLVLRDGSLAGEIHLDQEPSGTTSLRVSLARPPENDALALLPGVRQAQALGSGAFRLELAPDTDAAAIAAALVAGGWGPRELTPERPALERLFLDLMTGQGDV